MMTLLLVPVMLFAQAITADWDKKADFSVYKSYSVERGKIPANAPPLVLQRIEASLDSELSALGLLKVAKGGELTVTYHAATTQDVSLATGAAKSGVEGNIDKIPMGMLVVDVTDTKAQKRLWRATATDTINETPQQNEKKIHNAVTKMFERYPTVR